MRRKIILSLLMLSLVFGTLTEVGSVQPPERYPPPEPPIVIEPDPGYISNTVGETRMFNIYFLEDIYTTVYWIKTDMQEVIGWRDTELIDFQNHPGLIKQDVNVKSSQIDLPATTAGEFVVIAAFRFEEGGPRQTISWTWEIKPSPKPLSQMPVFGVIVGIIGLLLLTAWAWLMRIK